MMISNRFCAVVLWWSYFRSVRQLSQPVRDHGIVA